MITRQGTAFQFQTLNDPVDPFGAEKVPHHTALRLKDFLPNLLDLLIFSSSAVPDIGLLARSKSPLAPNGPVNVFSNIELADDSKRATLPMGEELDSPAAIGASLDLSSKDRVYKPIPTDELDQSPGPLPGYWVLNEQGILSIWWVIYSESIRGGTTYAGLAAVESATAAPAPALVPQTAPFGASNSSPFGTAQAPTRPTFGGPSLLGAKSSPWATASATTNSTGGATFGSSTFGSSSSAGASQPLGGTPAFGTSSVTPAFGQASTPVARPSPWGSTSTQAVGQSGFANTSSGVFGSTPSNNTSDGGGFSSFANKGGFAALGSNTSADKPNIFASTKPTALDTSMDTTSNTSFPPPSSKPDAGSGNPFASQPFKLMSSFKADPNVAEADDSKTSLFDTGFASTLNEAAKPTPGIFGGGNQGLFGQASKTDVHKLGESTTPPSTPAKNPFSQTPSVPPTSGLFGSTANSSGGIFGTFPSKPSVLEPPQSQTTVSEGGPLPPESTSKATYPIGDSSSSSAITTDNGDAQAIQSKAGELPLPSDSPADSAIPTKKPTSLGNASLPPAYVKGKGAYSTPLPPLPGDGVKSKAVSDAPLPPDPSKNKKAYAHLPPLPGTSTVSKLPIDAPLPPDTVTQSKANENKLPGLSMVKSAVAGPGFKFPTELPVVSDSDDDDLEDGEASDAGSEGSGVDVAKDLSPSSNDAGRTPGFTPQTSFDGLTGPFTTISRPEPERRSIFGINQNAPVFPRPNPVSPRSPSPMRGALPPRMLRMDQQRSSSAPHLASNILAGSKKPPQSLLNSSIIGRDIAAENAAKEQQRIAKAKKEAEEVHVLVDEEDDAMQQLLTSEIEPTLELDEFIAHSGVAPPAGDSVPAQVEAVYRDINSMIDTLGLNARSLKAFVSGHEATRSDHFSKQDLAAPDEWTLGDIEHLTSIIDQVLGEALDEARVRDVEEKVAQVLDVQRELARDCNKQADLRKIINLRLDPEHASTYQSLPLSAEQAAQQSDLRRQLGHFQTLLAKAEEGLTLLKAKIVSVNSVSGRGGPVPTIEAIVRTITKMTSMVEKRSGDIDVLENHMRKLRLGSTGPTGSREESPFATPTPKRTLGSSIFSPERSIRESTPMRGSIMRQSMSGSISGMSGDMFRTPPRKKLSGFGDAERKAVKEKQERRAAIIGKLKNSIHTKGPSVIPMDDIA